MRSWTILLAGLLVWQGCEGSSSHDGEREVGVSDAGEGDSGSSQGEGEGATGEGEGATGEGEGEGAAAGEGEGEGAAAGEGEGEGAAAGEGEGEGAAEGEGEGEGAAAGEGEGEGAAEGEGEGEGAAEGEGEGEGAAAGEGEGEGAAAGAGEGATEGEGEGEGAAEGEGEGEGAAEGEGEGEVEGAAEPNCGRWSPDRVDCDLDGDGTTERQGDCNENDPQVHPGALELCEDSKDNDCNGATDDAGCTDDPSPVRYHDSGATENQNNSYCGVISYGIQFWLDVKIRDLAFDKQVWIVVTTPGEDDLALHLGYERKLNASGTWEIWGLDHLFGCGGGSCGAPRDACPGKRYSIHYEVNGQHYVDDQGGAGYPLRFD